QIDGGAHPEVSNAQAFNVSWAANWAANQLALSIANPKIGTIENAYHVYNSGQLAVSTTPQSWPSPGDTYQQSAMAHLALLVKHHANLSCGTP
ncbi:MAG TPA: hypothetical protein VME66_06755, partial [Candidatus Acidoferrales bacterium]|nr:hypothetical protein [Candidatus Acidoferrales bacterium]